MRQKSQDKLLCIFNNTEKFFIFSL